MRGNHPRNLHEHSVEGSQGLAIDRELGTAEGGEATAAYPRNLIVVEADARAHVIERYASLGEAVYFNNAMAEVVVGERGELVHESLQQESPVAQHLNELHIRLGADSRYRYAHAGLGGEWSRNDLRLTFAPFPELLELSLSTGFRGLFDLPDARLDTEGVAPEGVFDYVTGAYTNSAASTELRVSASGATLSTPASSLS